MTDFDAAAIPDELKERDQWLMWDSSSDRPKRPHWCGDFSVSWTDPEDWHSFEEAVEAAQKHETWGIGYVFAKGNDDYPRGLYGALDLDGCADDDGRPKDWLPSLEPIIDGGEAYVEYSPSGNGLHVPLVGFEPPEWWSDVHVSDAEHEGVEAYGSKFFTFTGDKLRGAGDEVAEAGEGVEEWLRRAYQSLTGEDPTEKTDRFDDKDVGGTHDETLDEEDVRDALEFINPDVDYTLWRDIGFALSDFFASDATAMSVFEDWSRGGSKWDDEAQKQAERIIEDAERGGGRTIGTVIHHAQKNGWEYPSSSRVPEEYQESGDVETDEADSDEKQSPSGGHSFSWKRVRAMYEDDQTDMKYARQAAADKILEEHDFATPRDTEIIWEYDPDTGVYSRDGGASTIASILSDGLGPHYSQHEKREILGKVRASTYISRDQFDAGESKLLCVGNGVLDLETRELMEHSPDFYFTRGISVDYDPDADAEMVEEFLDDIVRREEDKLTMLEMTGFALWPNYDYSKFMILFGEGANGKSTWYDVVTNLLGDDNVSGWTLQALSENRFAASDLVGKFANIAPDMPGTKINELGTLKTLTGGDTTMVEKKGEPAFEFTNSATLMFGANRPPVIPEASKAVKRRIVPIHLPKNFTNAEDDGNPDARDKNELLSELTTDEQLSGLLNLALDGLDRLRDNGDVSLPESEEERLEYYEQFSDPIKEFRVHCLENEDGARVKKSTVYDAYKQFCAENDYATKSANVFWRMLRQTTLTYDESRPEIDGDRVKVLNNTQFTDEGAGLAPGFEGSEVPDQKPTSTTSETSDETESSETIIADLTPGRGVTLTGTVAAVLDPKPWLEGEGTLKDESGHIDYTVRGEGLPELERGGEYRIRNATVRTDEDGLLQVEMRAGVTEVERVDKAESQSDLDSSGDSEANAATDGGGGVEVVDSKERVRRVLRERYDSDETPQLSTLSGATGLDHDVVEKCVEKIAQEKADPQLKPNGMGWYKLL